MLLYVKRMSHLFNNYVLARCLKRPSTAAFWYLPEPPTWTEAKQLSHYKQAAVAPPYLMNYRKKLSYSMTNKEGIILLPYQDPIGPQINPEAAFQYALGLHDQYLISKEAKFLHQFLHYANFFAERQSQEGLWCYEFDWFRSKSPWYSALAQARGASVMLRAWLHTKDNNFKINAARAFAIFSKPTHSGGFLHHFSPTGTYYFEEYPNTPTGVINGFMAALISLWDVQHWLKENWLDNLWQTGVGSLEKMLPYYTTKHWSLYDLDEETPIENVNSPRYHLLELHYLQVLGMLTESPVFKAFYSQRLAQYNNPVYRARALSKKLLRKIIYK